MNKPNTIIYIEKPPLVNLLVPAVETKVFVSENFQVPTILRQETIGSVPIPLPGGAVEIDYNNNDFSEPGVVVLPIESGGRGPTINDGETITTSLLQGILANTLSEDELNAALNTRLDDFTTSLNTHGVTLGEHETDIDQLIIDMGSTITSADLPDDPTNDIAAINTLLEDATSDAGKSQSGYATHNDTIILDFTWPNKPPVINLTHSHGTMFKTITEDVNGISYLTIPDQEVIYGHTGFVNESQFTIKAAIVKYAAPVVVPVNWDSLDIVAPGYTAANTIATTTVPCMGLRLRGSLDLESTGLLAVSGAAYAQVSIDGGPWVNISELVQSFEDLDGVRINKHFDIILTFDQISHTYRFRAQANMNAGGDPARELTAAIHIDSVTELGTGAILSNDLHIKWSVSTDDKSNSDGGQATGPAPETGETFDPAPMQFEIDLNTAKISNIDHPLVESSVPVNAVYTDTVYDDSTVVVAIALNTSKVSNVAHPTVSEAVPVGAIFTDTIYDDTTLQAEVDLNTAKISNVDHPLVQTAVPPGAVFTDTNDNTLYDDTVIWAAVDLNSTKFTNVAHPLVEVAVPIGAVFTDTVYDDTAIQTAVVNIISTVEINEQIIVSPLTIQIDGGVANTQFENTDYTFIIRTETFSTLSIQTATNVASEIPGVVSLKSRGTLNLPAILIEDDKLFSISTKGFDGVQFKNTGGLSVYVDGPPEIDIIPTRLNLEVVNIAGSVFAALAIDKLGDVTIFGDVTANGVRLGETYDDVAIWEAVDLNTAKETNVTYDDTAIQAAVDLNTTKVSNISHPLVEEAVPLGAVFTDTTYDDTTITAAVALNTAKVTDTDHSIDGVILSAPDASKWLLTVDNTGALVSTLIV